MVTAPSCTATSRPTFIITAATEIDDITITVTSMPHLIITPITALTHLTVIIIINIIITLSSKVTVLFLTIHEASSKCPHESARGQVIKGGGAGAHCAIMMPTTHERERRATRQRT